MARALRIAGVAVALLGCGGRRGDTYARATRAQEQCCEHLLGAPRDACLRQIVRVEDPRVSGAPANQATFACVEAHFVCDPGTGHATAASAQAQLECVQDLGR